MSQARNNILNKLRASNQAPSDTLERSVLKHDWDEAKKLKNFIERMEAVRAEIHHSTAKDWPKLVAGLCAKKQCKNLLASDKTKWSKQLKQQSDLPTLLHYNEAIEKWKEKLFYEIDASLTSTLGAIAETGSLIVWPTQDEPRLMSLVPPIHFAILEKESLYTTFSEAIADMDWASKMPSNALLISGPSKSADIEQTLAYGVHGPKELIVIII